MLTEKKQKNMFNKNKLLLTSESDFSFLCLIGSGERQ